VCSAFKKGVAPIQSWAQPFNPAQNWGNGTKRRPKNVAMLGTNYRRAKLADRKGDLTKEWYVYYSVRSPETGKFVRFRIKGDINRCATKRDRKELAAALISGLNEYLTAGWTPFEGMPQSENELLSVKDVFIRGLEFKSGTLARKSYLDYRSSSKFLIEYLTRKNLAIWPSEHLQRYHVQQFIDASLKQGMSTTRIRDIIGAAKSLWNALADRDIITTRPFEKLIIPARVRGHKNIPLSKEEMVRVSEHLAEHNPKLLTFCRFIYGAAIRPKELLMIRRSNIDFEAGTITIPNTAAKNKTTQTVDIPDELITQLIASGYRELQPTWLLFGKNLEPDTASWHRNRVSDLWNTLVRKALNIDKDMYGLKHRGAIDLLDEGVDIKRIQMHLRHSSLDITDKYLASMAGHRIQQVKDRKMGL